MDDNENITIIHDTKYAFCKDSVRKDRARSLISKVLDVDGKINHSSRSQRDLRRKRDNVN